MDELRKQLEAKRNEFKRFDSLPLSEQKKLTDCGCNPHEPAEIRKARKKKIHDELQKEFRAKSIDTRKQLLTLGLYDGDSEIGFALPKNERILRRVTGNFS